MIRFSAAARLTRLRTATALCLAVVILVGSTTGLLWQRIATSANAQLDLQHDLVGLDGLVSRGEAPDQRAQAEVLVAAMRQRPAAVTVGPELARVADVVAPASGAAPSLPDYLPARAAVQTRIIATMSAMAATQATLLASAAGLVGVLVAALLVAAVADARRRRRPPVAAVAESPTGDDSSYDELALLRDLDDAATRAIDAGAPLACVMVEVDHYPAYAQTQGAAAGAALLAEVADIVRDAVRASDGAYRVDETTFVLMLPGTDCVAAVRLAERLRESVLRALLAEGVTVSAGVAGIPYGADHAADLLAAARAALEDAKRQGRNQVRRSTVASDELAAARDNVGRH